MSKSLSIEFFTEIISWFNSQGSQNVKFSVKRLVGKRFAAFAVQLKSRNNKNRTYEF